MPTLLVHEEPRLPVSEMDAKELRAALDTLGISQREAARRLRVSDRAVRYWIAGEREIPGPVEALVECWLAKAQERSDE